MSITLPASLISQLVVGGSTVETDANYAVVSLVADYVTNILRFTLKSGTTAGSVFTVGGIGTNYEFVIDAITGKWFVNGSSINGTLAGGALTSIQTTFKGLRNTAETFAVNQNLLPGSTQVPW